MMNRIFALCATVMLLAGCSDSEQATTETAVDDTKIYRWRMVTTWPKNFPGMGTAVEIYADRVRKMTKGRMDIRVYGAGEIVPALEVFEAVSQGTVQMGHGASYYWKGKVPAAQFFTAVPFGFTAQEMNAWLFYGGGIELWRQLYAKYDLWPIVGGNTGVQMAGWFNREINSLEDIKGMKMRIPGMGGEVFERAGGIAVSLPGGEIFTSLQTGVIDATEWVGPYNDMAFGLHQVARYYYYPGWQEPGPALELIINKAEYDALPEDLKEILEVAGRAMNADVLSEYTARNNASLSELVDKHGIEIRRLPDDVIAEFKRIAKEVVTEVVDDDDPLTRQIYDSYSQFLENVSNYHEISERAYINTRGSGGQ